MSSHDVVVSLAGEDNNLLTYGVTAGGEEIGQIDIESEAFRIGLVATHDTAFIVGVSEGERINNGCLAPASRSVAYDVLKKHCSIRYVYDLENRLIAVNHAAA